MASLTESAKAQPVRAAQKIHLLRQKLRERKRKVQPLDSRSEGAEGALLRLPVSDGIRCEAGKQQVAFEKRVAARERAVASLTDWLAAFDTTDTVSDDTANVENVRVSETEVLKKCTKKSVQLHIVMVFISSG